MEILFTLLHLLATRKVIVVTNVSKIIEQRKNDIYLQQLDEQAVLFYSRVFIEEDVAVKYLNTNLFKNKFAMSNIARIAQKMKYPNNNKIMDVLLCGLKDANWPFFDEFIDTLATSFPRNILIKAIDDTLTKADEEEDYMWISGIYILSVKIGANNELQNSMIFDKRDF